MQWTGLVIKYTLWCAADGSAKSQHTALIRVNTLKGFLDEPLALRKADLPKGKVARVKITMVPNPNTGIW